MIGTRRLLSGGLAGAVLAFGLGAGGPDPGVALEAQARVLERATRADAVLARLGAELVPAVDAARRGAARVVAGDADPGPMLREAAALLNDADGAADDARAALGTLERARRARAAGAEPLPSAAVLAELPSIAAQLEGTAEAAADFAAMRRRATGLTERLDAALAALEGGDVRAAMGEVAAARSDHETLAAWEVELVTLPVWIETSDAMIGAVERIVEASVAGDEEAALAAAEDFAELDEEAEAADRALRIAVGEGGSAVTAAPMGRLASVLAAVAELRASVASVIETVADG